MSDPSSKSKFSLDISGVAGFFGGDVSVAAMATVHIYEGRRWLGWYNQPGSFEIAKRYGQLSRSRFWDALYPGVNVDPARLFDYDGGEGPKFIASQSGTILAKTGHIAHLFASECSEVGAIPPPDPIDPARKTTPSFVTIVELPDDAPVLNGITRDRRMFTSALASIPILTSLGACVGCAVIRDWYCFATILLGVVSSGLSCYVIGLGTLRFKHPDPAPGAPRGDGILDDGKSDLIVLKGKEDAVNSITRGQFSLDYDSKPKDRAGRKPASPGRTSSQHSPNHVGPQPPPKFHRIGLCSMLLTLQFIVQLLLIPQGSLHGQLFFLATLACAWAYNSYLASFDRREIQREILRDKVLKLNANEVKRYELRSRTQMATLALLFLAPATKEALKAVLDDLLPNNTEVWEKWKKEVLHRIDQDLSEEGVMLDFSFRFDEKPCPHDSTRPEDLAQTLRNDATEAAKVFAIHQEQLRSPAVPSETSRHSTLTSRFSLFCHSQHEGSKV